MSSRNFGDTSIATAMPDTDTTWLCDCRAGWVTACTAYWVFAFAPGPRTLSSLWSASPESTVPAGLHERQLKRGAGRGLTIVPETGITKAGKLYNSPLFYRNCH